jgi:hypothetical protein
MLVGGMQPPEGPPIWAALNSACRRTDAAADVVDDLAQRHADGDLDQAGVLDRAGQGEDLGALAGLGADRGVPVGALEEDGRGRRWRRSRRC